MINTFILYKVLIFPDYISAEHVYEGFTRLIKQLLISAAVKKSELPLFSVATATITAT